jgi:branched-chain amino acid transport system permease protein
METSIYLPLRKRGSSSLTLLLASLGIYIVLQNVISMIFGDDTKIIRSGSVTEGLGILGARVTPIQLRILGVSVVLLVLATVFLQKTKNGRAMRAVASDALLARVSGIDSDRVLLWAFALGSALAGVAGILVSLDIDMTPTMGMNALMMGVVAVITGGVGRTAGVAFGALLIGTVQHLGVWYINSKWQDAVVFVILLAFLLFRPEGFLGKKVSETAV